jgi:hypothetical protein
MKRLFFLAKLLFLIVFTLLLTGAISCSGSGSSPRYIFLITLDTTRADYIDYSLNNSTTPNLATLAANGQYFENAFTLIPITLPSHAAMLYSMPPHRLKQYNNGQTRTFSMPSTAQLLKQMNFNCGAVISLGVLKSDFGLAEGFDHYVENFRPFFWEKSADEVNRDAFQLIKQMTACCDNPHHNHDNREKSFFWLHYSDPHEPYFPPVNSGFFRVMLEDKQVFSSRSTEQPSVKLPLTLKPGKNVLSFETAVPNEFKNYPDCSVKYIKYRDFQVNPAQQGSGSEVKPEITVPGDWNSRREGSGINYYSEPGKSEVVIWNPEKTAVKVTLSFIYSMNVNDTALRTFYREEVRYMDSRLGILMDFLKRENLYDDSVFVIMGDHGENLGEYREHFGHIHYLNLSATRVPLILSGKGIEPLGKRTEVVSNLNIAPTILQLADGKIPRFMLGHPLTDKDLQSHSASRLLLETYSPEAYFDAFSIVEYPFQVVFYPGRREDKLEFFDIRNDPQGIKPIQANSETRTQLVNAILKISRIITATKGKIGKTSKRHEEILKSLGYL